MFNLVTKTIAGALCALALTSVNVQPAAAGDNGGGLAIGLATGLILGGVLQGNRHRRHQPSINYSYSNYDDDYEDCRRERYLVWQCYKDRRGRKHCNQVERLGRVICY